MLSPTMAFFGTQQIFKNVADDILAELAEIKFIKQADGRPPAVNREIGDERHPVNKAAIENGLIIARDDFGLLQQTIEMIPQAFGRSYLLRNCEFLQAEF